MVKQDRLRNRLIAGGLVLIAVLIWLLLMHEFRLDDSFITYRYARSVTRGWGLIYNQGEAVLSTTAPLYALILALFSLVIPDFHILGGFIGSMFIGLGGVLIVNLLPRRIPALLRAWGGLLYVLSTPLWLALGMETPLWIMLVLLAAHRFYAGYYRQSGLLVGFAILVRPDAALPGLLLGLIALVVTVNASGTRRRWWLPLISYGSLALIPPIFFSLWAWLTYGSPFPATLSAKSAQAALGITGLGVSVDTWTGLRLIIESLLMQSPLYGAFGLLLIVGLSRRLSPRILVIVGSGLLHLAAYIVLGVAPYRWYYLPLLPGVILLMVLGAWRIVEMVSKRNLALGLSVLALILIIPAAASIVSFVQIADYFERGGERQVMLPIVDWQAYRQAGEWLNQNSLPDALIGVAEVGQLGFYADRHMTDYLGLLQPEVAALLKRGDLYTWLVGYAPDYLVFQRFGGKVGLALYNYFIEYDPWFVANYHEVAKFDDPRYVLGPVVIYRRELPIDRAVETQPASADYGPLRLVGFAADSQGKALRVRLDWQVISRGDLPADLHIGMALLDAPAEVKFDGDYHTAHWSGELSTWHSLMLPDNMLPGRYPLWVSIGLIGGGYVPQTVGTVEFTTVQ